MIQRATFITTVLLKYFLFQRFSAVRKSMSPGVRMRLACEELGPVFIKMGQVMSTRYDLLKMGDAQELQKLLDSVPPVPYEEIKNVFVEDFGKTPDELYAEFHPVPIASASMSQVYKAKLYSGESVAVKVRRPGIKDKIVADIKVLKLLASIAGIFSSTLQYLDVGEVLRQLESWMLGEADFVVEVRNMETMGKFVDRVIGAHIPEIHGSVVVPRTYSEFSSPRVISMEFIDGILLTQCDTIRATDGYDLELSLKRYSAATLRAWFYEDTAYFHADLHPANLMILPNGGIALLDLGLLGYLDKSLMESTREIGMAVYKEDLDRLIECTLDMCNASVEDNKAKLKDGMRQYMKDAQGAGMGFWLMGIVELMVKHRITLPYSLVQFARSNTVFDGTLQTAMPGVTELELFGDEYERVLRRRVVSNLMETDFRELAYEFSDAVRKSPHLIAKFIRTYIDSPLDFVADVSAAVRGRRA